MKINRTSGRVKRRKSRLTASQKKFLCAFGIPACAAYFYVCFLPALKAVYNSFTEWNGYSAKVWVGLSNYLEILQDRVFRRAIVNDLHLIVIKEVLIVTLALVFAVSLTRIRLRKPEKAFLRFIYYMPNMLSVIVITMVWRFFFNLGLFDGILSALHIGLKSRNGWLSDYPMQIIGFIASWCGIGSYMIILISAINNVPKEIYEAADIDGAGQLTQLFRITLPDILSQVRYMIVTILTSSLAANMNLVLPFTNGGPGTRSMVMGLYVYQSAYSSYKVGYANAAAVLLMLISVTLAAVVNLLILRKERD